MIVDALAGDEIIDITTPVRRRVLSDPSVHWHWEQVGRVEPLVEGSPLVEVTFEA